jgi:hypothetical protein
MPCRGDSLAKSFDLERHAVPFMWTATAGSILAKERPGCVGLVAVLIGWSEPGLNTLSPRNTTERKRRSDRRGAGPAGRC